MYQDKTNEDLEQIVRENVKKIDELHKLVAEHRKIVNEANKELQSRSKWNYNVVINNMLEILKVKEDTITKNAYIILKRAIIKVKDSDPINKARVYRQGDIIKNIYFDISNLITTKLEKYDLIFGYNRSVSPRFLITFSFNTENNSIVRNYRTNIFSKSKNMAYNFYFDNDKIIPLNKDIINNTKVEYDSYEEVIDDMIKLVNYIEVELDAILLAYNLSYK